MGRDLTAPRRLRRLSILAMVAATVALATSQAASAPNSPRCSSGEPPRGHLAEVKKRVAALHLIEREAADRSAGLDTRPYEWLLEQARAAEKAIAVPDRLAAEEALRQTQCPVTPLRTSCAGGSAALIRVIEDLAGGRDTNEARMALAQSMPPCERIVGLTPPKTSLRTFTSPPQDPQRRDAR